MTCHVFISYRRKDSGAWAGRIFDRLAQVFPAKSVFFDVDGIEPGQDFSRALTERLSTCKVMLVVIGSNWLQLANAGGQRLLDQPTDYVAAEVQAALERDIRVIPVLVDGARMPAESELPPRLRPLAWRHAVELTHARFTADSEVLVESVTRSALSEFPVIASTVEARVKPQIALSPRRLVSGTMFAIGFALLGMMMAIGGVVTEFLPNELRAFDGRVHINYSPSERELWEWSVVRPIFDARWFVFGGIALALSGIAFNSIEWRQSVRGARSVVIICLPILLACGLIGVCASIYETLDNLMRVPVQMYFIKTVEFTVMMSGGLFALGAIVAAWHLRFTLRSSAATALRKVQTWEEGQ